VKVRGFRDRLVIAEEGDAAMPPRTGLRESAVDAVIATCSAHGVAEADHSLPHDPRKYAAQVRGGFSFDPPQHLILTERLLRFLTERRNGPYPSLPPNSA